MPQFTISRPDGTKYNVDAPDAATATKDLESHLQSEMNTQSQKESADAPTWQKPFMAADDVVRSGADRLTFGMLDKMIGGNAAMETKARRSRMSGADVLGDAALSAAALPTAVPRAMAAVGGGPAIRAITGLL